MNKELPIIDVPASGKPDWYGGAFTYAFVYSKKGNFILRGYRQEVRDYLKHNHTHYFVNYTLYNNGQYRNIWEFWKNKEVSIYPERVSRGRKTYKRGMKLVFHNDKTKKEILFKRLPKRWIPDFDSL